MPRARPPGRATISRSSRNRSRRGRSGRRSRTGRPCREREAARHGARETCASPSRRSLECPGDGHADPDLAVPIRRRHLQLEALNAPRVILPSQKRRRKFKQPSAGSQRGARNLHRDSMKVLWMTSRRPGLTRRQLLVRSASTFALAGLGSLAKPYLSRAADRPQIACGIQSGDVDAGAAVVWSRADRPARMRVEYSDGRKLCDHSRRAPRDALPESDFTAKLLLDNLPAGQRHLLSRALRRHCHGLVGRNAASGISAPPRANASRFRLSGRATPRGRAGASMRAAAATAAIIPCWKTAPTSSFIAAITSTPTAPIPATQCFRTARSGATSSPRKNPRSHRRSRQFRGNYQYNWLDANLRAFHAEV